MTLNFREDQLEKAQKSGASSQDQHQNKAHQADPGTEAKKAKEKIKKEQKRKGHQGK